MSRTRPLGRSSGSFGARGIRSVNSCTRTRWPLDSKATFMSANPSDGRRVQKFKLVSNH